MKLLQKVVIHGKDIVIPMPSPSTSCGIFIDLTAMDLICSPSKPPSANEKVVATDLQRSSGVPATNTAVIFATLGGQATLLGVISQHSLAQLIHGDLANCQFRATDLDFSCTELHSLLAVAISEVNGN